MKKLWFIRHAESLSNAGFITDTPHSIGLSELGIQQSASLARHWHEEPDLMVITPYQRTGDTAQPLRERYPDCPVITVPLHEFTFLAPSKYSGTTEDTRREPARQYWERAEPEWQDGEGAESYRSFVERIESSLAILKQREEKNIMVFCHGYVIKQILWRALNPHSQITSDFMRRFFGFHLHMQVHNTQVFPAWSNPSGHMALLPPLPLVHP